MKYYISTFLLLFLVKIGLIGQSNNLYSLPYDIIITGFDTDIDDEASQVILVLSNDIENGFNFGLSNSIQNNNVWTTFNENQNSYINIKYVGSEMLSRGTALSINFYANEIKIVGVDGGLTELFEIEYHNYLGDFIPKNSFALTVFSGKMLSIDNSTLLLGTVLDGITFGLNAINAQNFIGPISLLAKNINIPSSQVGVATVQITPYQIYCDLCEFLVSILSATNWIQLQSTSVIDIDLSYFDIRDCLEANENNVIIRRSNIVGETINPVNLKLFPNPTRDLVIISCEYNSTIEGHYRIELYDYLGRKQYTKQVITTQGNNKWEIEVEKFGAGMYFFNFVEDNSTILWSKNLVIL